MLAGRAVGCGHMYNGEELGVLWCRRNVGGLGSSLRNTYDISMYSFANLRKASIMTSVLSKSKALQVFDNLKWKQLPLPRFSVEGFLAYSLHTPRYLLP